MAGQCKTPPTFAITVADTFCQSRMPMTPSPSPEIAMSERVVVAPLYGTVEVQTRPWPQNGGMGCQSRKVTTDENGIAKATEWKFTGAVIYYNAPETGEAP